MNDRGREWFRSKKGDWHHLVVISDHSRPRVYVDGVLRRSHRGWWHRFCIWIAGRS